MDVVSHQVPSNCTSNDDKITSAVELKVGVAIEVKPRKGEDTITTAVELNVRVTIVFVVVTTLNERIITSAVDGTGTISREEAVTFGITIVVVVVTLNTGVDGTGTISGEEVATRMVLLSSIQTTLLFSFVQ